MDLISQWLTVSAVHGTFGGNIEAGGDWGVRWDGTGDALIYAVTSGTAWIVVAGMEPVQLLPGDAYLVASATPHALASSPGSLPAECDAQIEDGRRSVTMRLGSWPYSTQVLAARYSYDAAITTQVLSMLPTTVFLEAASADTSIGDTLRLLARELKQSQLAEDLVLDRLVDVMLVYFLRSWINSRDRRNDREFVCLLGALTEPVVRDSISLIHAEPSRNWTADTLATGVAVSRSTLIRRFSEIIGTTPAAYLTQWRMDLATRLLRDTVKSVESIAREVGYTSVPAFTRAFSRTHKSSPGAYRRKMGRELAQPRSLN